MAQEGSYCSSSNYSSDLSSCLKCAETCEIWQYYGTEVKYAAGNCSDSATPSSSSSASSCASTTVASTATNMAATATSTSTGTDVQNGERENRFINSETCKVVGEPTMALTLAKTFPHTLVIASSMKARSNTQEA